MKPFELARLLEHPAIWRGTRVAAVEVLPTGFDALDSRLPGGGWPRSGLIEILASRFGVGELSLLLPTLAQLTTRPMARWCAWVAAPFDPFAPALASHGVELNRLLVVRPQAADSRANRWAFEQALGSGACDVVMGWAMQPKSKSIRRLQLAAERGGALGVLFRSIRAARESSHAMLRLAVEPCAEGLRTTLLKSRGGIRGAFEIQLRPGSDREAP